MLDEFPALGRLDFFESALAFMAGYGLKSFLIAQSLNQIEKAYGANNAILDNCHVRVSFATNDERTAKRISDALGTATEMRAMQELCRPPALALARPSHGLAPGDRAAAADARRGDAASADRRLVMVSGRPPIRAKKVRYFEDPRACRRACCRRRRRRSRQSDRPSGVRRRLGCQSGGPTRDPSRSIQCRHEDPGQWRHPPRAGAARARGRRLEPTPAATTSSSFRTMTRRTPSQDAQRAAAPDRQVARQAPSIPTTASSSDRAHEAAAASVFLAGHCRSTRADYAAEARVSQSLIAEAALASFLSPDARRAARGGASRAGSTACRGSSSGSSAIVGDHRRSPGAVRPLLADHHAAAAGHRARPPRGPRAVERYDGVRRGARPPPGQGGRSLPMKIARTSRRRIGQHAGARRRPERSPASPVNSTPAARSTLDAACRSSRSCLF